jgi:hypothetical protein
MGFKSFKGESIPFNFSGTLSFGVCFLVYPSRELLQQLGQGHDLNIYNTPCFFLFSLFLFLLSIFEIVVKSTN